MNESQAANQAVSMVVKLYLGILTGIPELFTHSRTIRP